MSMSLRRALLGAAPARSPPPCRPPRKAPFPPPVTLIVPSCRRLHRPPPAHRGAGRIQYLASRHRGKPAGAGGTGPANMAKTAKPDGYTISLHTLAMLRMPYMHKTHWDPINDFTFLIGLSGYTFGFTVRADSPYRTFNDYIEAARKAPAASTTARPARARRRTC